MSSGFFAALRDDDDGDSSSSDNGSAKEDNKKTAITPQPLEGASVTVPAFEDLSSARMNEEFVLQSIYGDDFSAKMGVWNCPCWTIRVRPPDLDPAKIGSHLLLQVQLSKKYPYVVPKIDLQEVTGLSPEEQEQLRLELHEGAKALAQNGTEMMLDLVKHCEDFLLAHNRNPNMSAWEQMQEREKNQRLKANEANEALDKIMENDLSAVTFDDTSGRLPTKATVGTEDYERELLRQREAFEKARQVRLELGTGIVRRTSSGTHENSYEEEDFEIDLDYNPAAVSASRYETDFIELGVLGAGGGGEVVKARNRLDGRIYAIKKILLEQEDGAMAKIGALQNQKLRREVTTISRVTHNNIVRYYQAWVEGDGADDGGGSSSLMQNNEDEFEPSTTAVKVIEEGSDEESDSSRGWWTNSPDTKGAGTLDASLDEPEIQQVDASGLEMESDSAMDLFNDDFGMQSPLMTGLGFQNNMYRRMAREDGSSSKSESVDEESLWDEDSAVKVGSGVKGRKVLYIQMEFCSTTLRELIDQRKLEKMEENETWRLIRQITEALAYIHGRKLIHRDLKPGKSVLPRVRSPMFDVF